MIKLIASDIDGTLVPEGSHEISHEYFKVIEDLKEVGIRFCACSGRQYASMLDLFRPIADDIYFISGNGTVLRTKDRMLHVWPLEKDLVLQLIEAVRGIEGACFVVENPDRCYMDHGEDSDFMKMLRDGYHYDVHNVDDITKIPMDNIVKVSIYCDGIEPRTEELRHDPRFAKMNMLISGAKWLDVTAIESGKGEAYALLQEYLGIGIEETVYFGDNLIIKCLCACDPSVQQSLPDQCIGNAADEDTENVPDPEMDPDRIFPGPFRQFCGVVRWEHDSCGFP